MRRFALIFGMLLTLTAGVWANALAAAADWCAHETSAAAVAAATSNEHDCCRARVGEPDAHHAATADDEATHEDASSQTQAAPQAQAAPQIQAASQGQSVMAHAAPDCCDARAAYPTLKTRAAAALGGRTAASCAECCAGRTNPTPPTAAFAAPEQSKLKRDAGSDTAQARELFAPPAPDASRFAPKQHAPPAPTERRHILISIFLI